MGKTRRTFTKSVGAIGRLAAGGLNVTGASPKERSPERRATASPRERYPVSFA